MRKMLDGVVKRGMFPDEKVVLLADHHGQSHAVIVPDTEVKPSTEGHGKVAVQVIDQDDSLSLVALPGEILSDGRYITVRTASLHSNGV